MLNLDDPRWNELNHAYGSASDTPTLLRRLEANPDIQEFGGITHTTPLAPPELGQWNPGHYASYHEFFAEPWLSLWMSLCHQGTVYTASFAAVPHIVRIATLAVDPPALDYLLLPTMIERGRRWPEATQVPADLADSYFQAVGRLPALVPRLSSVGWDEWSALAITGALLRLCGQQELGEGIELMKLNDVRRFWRFYGEILHMEEVQVWKEFDTDDPSFVAGG